MYTIQDTLNHIQALDGWGELVDRWDVADRAAIVWTEEVESKITSNPWRTSYIVRYWEDGEWVDTRSFFNEDDAREFARDFVNQPHRLPYPTD